MSGCPWCTGPAWLCMHDAVTEEEEAARFAEFTARTGLPILPLEADSDHD